MRTILPWISINGAIQKNNNIIPKIEKYAFGNGVFTTVKIKNRIPLFLHLHYKRLFDNFYYLHKNSPELHFPLTKKIFEIIAKNNLQDGAVRITVTKKFNEIFCIIHATTLDTANPYINVITLIDKRNKYKTIKSLDRKVNNEALQLAIEHNAQDALLIDEDNIIESTYANIFAQDEKNNIITPPINKKGLNGIVRQILMSKLPVKETNISITTKQSLLLVNSLEIRIVKKLNGNDISIDKKFIEIMKNVINNEEEKYIANYNL